MQKLKQIKGIKSVSLKDDTILIGTDEDLRQEISKVVSSVEEFILTKNGYKRFFSRRCIFKLFKEV